MPTKHLARQQRFGFAVHRWYRIGAVVDRPLIHYLTGFFKLLGGYNLQFQDNTRAGFSAAEHPRIREILQHPPHGGGMPLFARSGAVAVVVEPGRDGVGTQPLAGVFIKNNLHHQRLVRIHLQVKEFVLFLIGAPVFHKVVAIGSTAALVVTRLHDLTQARFGTHRGFFALAVRLPKTDIV